MAIIVEDCEVVTVGNTKMTIAELFDLPLVPCNDKRPKLQGGLVRGIDGQMKQI